MALCGRTPAERMLCAPPLLQAHLYLKEGERLLKTLKDDKSWSHTFEAAAFYSLKGQVRRRYTRGHVSAVPGALGRSSRSPPCPSSSHRPWPGPAEPQVCLLRPAASLAGSSSSSSWGTSS